MKNNEVSSRSKSQCEGSVDFVALFFISIFVLGMVAMFSVGMKHGFQSISKGVWPFIFVAFIFIVASIARAGMDRRQLIRRP